MGGVVLRGRRGSVPLSSRAGPCPLEYLPGGSLWSQATSAEAYATMASGRVARRLRQTRTGVNDDARPSTHCQVLCSALASATLHLYTSRAQASSWFCHAAFYAAVTYT